MTIPRKIRAHVEIKGYSPSKGGFVQFEMAVTNISLTGCLIKTNQRLEIGAPVSFDIPLPDGRKLELDGTVVRAQTNPTEFGIQFATLPLEGIKELALLIAHSNEL